MVVVGPLGTTTWTEPSEGQCPATNASFFFSSFFFFGGGFIIKHGKKKPEQHRADPSEDIQQILEDRNGATCMEESPYHSTPSARERQTGPQKLQTRQGLSCTGKLAAHPEQTSYEAF